MPKVPMWVKVTVPLVGLLLGLVVLVITAGVFKAWWSMPFGMFQVKETQPIQFPHDIHAGQLGIDCLFCHRNANNDESASIPSVQQCMICHQVVEKGPDQAGTEDIARLREAYAKKQPINWVRVHRLPDHVEFTHEAHIKFFSTQNNIPPSQVCSTCHGDVKTMQVDEQVRNLKMRDCVDCHRDGYLSYLTSESKAAVRQAVEAGHMAPPPTDCFQCHY